MKSTNFYEQNAVLAKNIQFLEHSELDFLKKLRFGGYSIMGGTALCKLGTSLFSPDHSHFMLANDVSS